MVEQWNKDGRTVEQRWENSGTSDGGTVMEEQQNICWWNRGTFDDGTVEQWNKAGGKVQHRLELGVG